MRRIWGLLLLVASVTLSGCATIPLGPSVMVLPAPGKPFEQFQAENAICRQWADQQVGVTPGATVTENTATGAAVGTAIGAGLGAAIGAASGHPGVGAAIGAGSGLLVGTAEGANAGRAFGWEVQRRYDIAYQQCMYAKGNQIPGVVRESRRGYGPPPPPPPPLPSSLVPTPPPPPPPPQ